MLDVLTVVSYTDIDSLRKAGFLVGKRQPRGTKRYQEDNQGKLVEIVEYYCHTHQSERLTGAKGKICQKSTCCKIRVERTEEAWCSSIWSSATIYCGQGILQRRMVRAQAGALANPRRNMEYDGCRTCIHCFLRSIHPAS